MPLFECEKCKHIDNTAGGGNWWWHKHDGEPAQCAECYTGKWHDLFPKKTAEQWKYVKLQDGFFGPVGGWKSPQPEAGE